MSFLFPVALGGLTLIAVPILVHLILRQKPRTLVFPAFRFLLSRHRRNLRKLRLRHIVLLSLRILIVVALFFALAQPLLFSTGAGLGGDHPVAVVFVFDTSPRMGYKASDGATRLDLAREQAQKLLAELHPDSKILVLDSGLAPPSGKKGSEDEAKAQDWTASLNQASERIGNLKVRPSTRSLVDQIKYGLDRLGELAVDRDNDKNRALPRFLCAFSDRTRGAWQQDDELAARLDNLPPTYDSLRSVHGDLPEFIELVKETRLPPAGSPDQALLDALSQLESEIVALTPEDVPFSAKKLAPVSTILHQSRDLLRHLEAGQGLDTDEKRERLIKQARKVTAKLRGAQCLFFDVGLDEPVDLALVRLEPPVLSSGAPRQIFVQNEKWTLRAVVRASGKDQSATLLCKLPAQTLEATMDFPAGKETAVTFEIDGAKEKWDAGFVQLEVALKNPDQLLFNNQRFLTVAIREQRRVLVIAEEPKAAADFVQALGALGFAVDLKTPEETVKLGKLGHHAVYLFEVEDPRALWKLLDDHVAKGGGLGVVPGRRDMGKHYNVGKAAELLPGSFKEATPLKNAAKKEGATWDLESDDTIFGHRLMKPFKQWHRDKVDFISYPRLAMRAWEIDVYPNGQPLVRYADAKKLPALLETPPDPKAGRLGKVLLFTTPLDTKEPAWTNYRENVTSFYIVLIGVATNYLAGNLEEVMLNFTTDQPDPPSVKLPPGKTYVGFSLVGPGVRRDLTPPEDGTVSLPDARTPGNYTLDGIVSGTTKDRIAAFSVNLPASEGDLSRLEPAVIERLFGPDTVLALTPTTDLKDTLRSYRSEPLRLLPLLMLAVLFLLAGENLLANLFYRKESKAEGDAA